MKRTPDLLSVETVMANFAAAGIAISERTLRSLANRTGHCRKLGRRMFFTRADFAALIAATRPRPRSSADPAPPLPAEIGELTTQDEIDAFADSLEGMNNADHAGRVVPFPHK